MAGPKNKSAGPTGSGLTRTALLDAIKRGEGQFGNRELARELRLKGDDKAYLKDALMVLEDEGVITKDNRRNYSLAGALPAVTVVIITGRDEDGELLAAPARDDRGPAPVIRLAPGEGAGGGGKPAIGVGDKALVRLSDDGEGGFSARIIKALGGTAQKILCVLRKPKQGQYRLQPIDKRNRYELVPVKGEAEKAEDGDLVLCAIARERRYGLKTAEIVEVIGNADTAGAGSIIAMYAHGIPTGFADAELKEVKKAKKATSKNRDDLRDIPLITIDPADAKDHDDAVWAAPDDAPKNQGGWIVMVAIADVAAYVEPGGHLDKGAFKRGNSVYLPDRVVPMLPERLSNDLCSLREGEERPCLAVRMVFDKNGIKRDHRFLRGWMKSAAKLSYNEAQDAIDGKGTKAANKMLKPVLQPLWGAYAALKEARKLREPLDINMPERRVRVAEDGTVTGVETRDRFDAHKLVEEFMIQANVCAAETLEAKRTPQIYRVHEEPGTEKINNLAEFLPSIGFKWTRGEQLATSRFNRLLKQSEGTDHYETVNMMVLRSQSQAVYSTNNQGHFGLNLERYAHFTSPIRRYADLTVHRALIRAEKLGNDGQTDEERSRLDVIADEISQTERRAMAAERDAVDRFIALFLADRVGSQFEGKITSVTRFGAFVRLEDTGADGLVPISRLGRERFTHDERIHTLIGEETGGRFPIGMKVSVKIEEAQPITGGLLLEILTPAIKGPRPKRGKGSYRASSNNKSRRGGTPRKKGKRR
jgi:ribonuclease R